MLCPSARVVFTEPDPASKFPDCMGIVAAAHAVGFRLADDPHGNHWDAIYGMKHVGDFKGASPRKLQRIIVFRFHAGEISFEGEKFRVEQFVERCCGDAAFYRAAVRHPHYPIWERALAMEIPQIEPAITSREPGAHGRVFTAPQRCSAQDEKLVALLDGKYENG